MTAPVVPVPVSGQPRLPELPPETYARSLGDTTRPWHRIERVVASKTDAHPAWVYAQCGASVAEPILDSADLLEAHWGHPAYCRRCFR